MAIGYKRKSCATCEYWAGPRKADPFRNGSLCDSRVSGVCGVPRGGNSGKNMPAEYGGCSKYSTWAVLVKKY